MKLLVNFLLPLTIVVNGNKLFGFYKPFLPFRAQKLTVSSGAISGRPSYPKGHPCLLKLISSNAENQNLPQYCPYMNQQGGQNHSQGSPPHGRQGGHGRHGPGPNNNGGGGGGNGQNHVTTHDETPTPAETVATDEAAPRSQCESSCANEPRSNSITNSPSLATAATSGEK